MQGGSSYSRCGKSVGSLFVGGIADIYTAKKPGVFLKPVAHRTPQHVASGHATICLLHVVCFRRHCTSAHCTFFVMRAPETCVCFLLTTLALEDAPHGLRPTPPAQRERERLYHCDSLPNTDYNGGLRSQLHSIARDRARFRRRRAVYIQIIRLSDYHGVVYDCLVSGSFSGRYRGPNRALFLVSISREGKPRAPSTLIIFHIFTPRMRNGLRVWYISRYVSCISPVTTVLQYPGSSVTPSSCIPCKATGLPVGVWFVERTDFSS